MRFLLPTVVIFVLCAPVFAAGDSDPLHIRYDTALWSIVVFVGLLIILRAKAWGPILEGFPDLLAQASTQLAEDWRASIASRGRTRFGVARLVDGP